MDVGFDLNSTKWIENLALKESQMEETGIVDFNSHINPELLMEESSIEFVQDLRELFEIYVSKFNSLRDKLSNKHIRVFKISNTVNDFMIFRNSLKLVVSRMGDDCIQIGFIGPSSGIKSGQDFQSSSEMDELRAFRGPFGEIQWKYQGQEINKESLAKHFFTEFVLNSMQ